MIVLGASAALLSGCEPPYRDAVGVVTYGAEGPVSLEFVICADDSLNTATIRVGASPTSPALIVNEPKASGAEAIPVRIDFSIDAARAGSYSDDVRVEDVRGFAGAIEDAQAVTAVSAEFGDTWFSSNLPRSIRDGEVLLVVGANAEKTGGLQNVTRQVADQQLAASCGGG